MNRQKIQMINRPREYMLVFIMILMCSTAWAKVKYWQCTVVDAAKREWTFEHRYRLPALNHALDACKKVSRAPESCKSISLGCDLFIDGRSTRPFWQCTAMDHSGAAWKSSGYRHKYEAAFAAKSLCRQKSKNPATCYMHLIACRNLHAVE